MELSDLYQIISPEEIKARFKWKAALCQHPMYMLIDEDRGEPIVGERVGPWGAPDADTYVKRVERNLESLASHDDIKINYEFSAYELTRLCGAYPHVYKNIKKAIREGKLGFVNGTYSQPHLQTLGSESNWRQFEEGLKVYKELFGIDIKLYVTQETALHKQIPQLLACFGFEMMALPAFLSAIEVTEGGFELAMDNYKGFRPVQGADFIQAQSLNGLSLPAYIGFSEIWDRNSVRGNVDRDLFAEPKLRVSFPDMIDIDEEYYRGVKELHEFALMEEELRAMLKETKPSAKAWLYTYWSYIEGMWAEELLRSSREAEQAALAAEALMCLNWLKTGMPGDEPLVEKWWAVILKYQHHDVYWHEVTDLRRKAIDANLAVKGECEAFIREVSEKIAEPESEYVSALNWLPEARRVEIKTKTAIAGVISQRFQDEVFSFCDLNPGGFTALKLAGKAAPSVKMALPSSVKFGAFEAVLDSNGLISQISGVEPAKNNGIYIGEIRGIVGEESYNNRAGETEFYDGPAASIVSRRSSLKDIGLSETYFFYKNEGYIKVEVEFQFHGNDAGIFWFDDSKINIHIPTSGNEIYHDIPFGYTQAKPNRPIFAINWLHSGGLVFVNGGNVKHFVRDGVITNVVAWGGTRFDNRMHMEWAYNTQYDLRLYGNHKITYYIIPVAHFNGAEVSKRVAGIKTPVYISEGRSDGTVFRLDRGEDILVSSLYLKGGEAYYRGVKLPSEATSSDYPDFTIINKKIPEGNTP